MTDTAILLDDLTFTVLESDNSYTLPYSEKGEGAPSREMQIPDLWVGSRIKDKIKWDLSRLGANGNTRTTVPTGEYGQPAAGAGVGGGGAFDEGDKGVTGEGGEAVAEEGGEVVEEEGGELVEEEVVAEEGGEGIARFSAQLCSLEIAHSEQLGHALYKVSLYMAAYIRAIVPLDTFSGSHWAHYGDGARGSV